MVMMDDEELWELCVQNLNKIEQKIEVAVETASDEEIMRCLEILTRRKMQQLLIKEGIMKPKQTKH